jgi:hypothetical protein
MSGSIASMIDDNDNDFDINPMKVQLCFRINLHILLFFQIKAGYLFTLLDSMQNLDQLTDQLDILGLVTSASRPLKALDLCYRDDPNTFCLLTDAMASCVTVCACAPESRRSYQMMVNI